MLRTFTGITFVLTHLASGVHEQTLEIADRFSNVIFDTSIAFTGEHCIYRIHDDFWEDDENAVKAFREIGFDRIAFGSDYPLANPASDIIALPISEEEKELILGKNSYKLYFNA